MEEITKKDVLDSIDNILSRIENYSDDFKIDLTNEIKKKLHESSPFKDEPVDCVLWVKNDSVKANDYNPNKVAPPEMELLEVSITNDGYTQPIVTWPVGEDNEVIDGFHRSRVGKESILVSNRVKGYLPIVQIRKEKESKNDRIASTIRHNRARGKHQVNAMSEIVIELKNRNWSNSRISKQLGMDEEEVLRLCQVSGLENLFSDKDFSKAWESSDEYNEYFEINNDLTPIEIAQYRTANTNDPERIFHTYDKWECNKAGFYANVKKGMTHEECENEYIRLLTNLELFASVLEAVINEWKYSCEQYLTNRSTNRIAWLGQAAVCYHSGVPARYKSAWSRITQEDQNKANLIALDALNKWMKANGRENVPLEEALSIGRQVEIY